MMLLIVLLLLASVTEVAAFCCFSHESNKYCCCYWYNCCCCISWWCCDSYWCWCNVAGIDGVLVIDFGCLIDAVTGLCVQLWVTYGVAVTENVTVTSIAATNGSKLDAAVDVAAELEVDQATGSSYLRAYISWTSVSCCLSLTLLRLRLLLSLPTS